MGLDSIWLKGRRQDQIERALHFDPPLCVMEASFVIPEEAAAFRGKAYAEAIETITGVSLYQDWIDNPTIRTMATALRAHVATPREIDQTPRTYPAIELDDDGQIKSVTIETVWDAVPPQHIADRLRPMRTPPGRSKNARPGPPPNGTPSASAGRGSKFTGAWPGD